MRHWIVSATIALAGGGPALAAPAAAPELNSCHGGICSWSITRARTLVRQDGTGILHRLSLLGGTAGEGSRRIRWQRQPHDVFIFCSSNLPTVILRVESRWQADVIDFVTGPPSYMESSASLYMRTCHPGEDMAAPGFATRHGYQVEDPDQNITLTRPEDIFLYPH